MIIEEIRNIKSETSDLKKFGLLIGAILFLGSLYLLWKQQHNYAVAGFILGVVFAALAFVGPVVLKPLQRAWMAMAVVMGFVMSRIIVAVIFYGMVTPIGLAGRLAGEKISGSENGQGCRQLLDWAGSGQNREICLRKAVLKGNQYSRGV